MSKKLLKGMILISFMSMCLCACNTTTKEQDNNPLEEIKDEGIEVEESRITYSDANTKEIINTQP